MDSQKQDSKLFCHWQPSQEDVEKQGCVLRVPAVCLLSTITNSHSLGMLDFGRSDDEARLHMLMRRDDFPILNLLSDGADFNQ